MKVYIKYLLPLFLCALSSCAENKGGGDSAKNVEKEDPIVEARLKVTKLKARVDELERQIIDYEKCASKGGDSCPSMAK